MLNKLFNKTSAIQPQITLFLVIIFLTGCVEKMILPVDLLEDSGTATVPSTNDTTFLQVNPVWDGTLGLMTPMDLSIARDGHIFIADSAATSIFVLDQSGARVKGFDILTNLQDYDGIPISPIDVDVDTKLNVFFIDGSNRIFRWNQYWNAAGIDSVMTAAVFMDTLSGDTITIEYGTLAWFEQLNPQPGMIQDMIIVKYHWSAEAELIDSYLKPQVFYTGANDPDYESARFSAITTLENTWNNNWKYLFVTDYANDRILEIYYARDNYIKLSSGDIVWSHFGVKLSEPQSYGTGSGTVNKPLGLDVDYENNLYYCQTGEVFSVHKISPDFSKGYLEYLSAFQLFQHDIMDLGRFSAPRDVAVDDNQMIYVSNSGAQEIQVFNSDGSFFKKAGIEEYRVDRELGYPTDSLAVVVDSTEYFYLIEEKGLLLNPAGITVDDRGVIYVCDPDQSSIFRFRLSNVLDEDIQPE